MVHRDRLDDWIDLAIVGHDRLGCFEAVLEQRRDQRVPIQCAVRGPGLGIEIAIHQELGEREEAENDRVRLDLPRLLGRDRLRDPGQIARDIDIVLVAKILDLEPELLVELGL